MATDANLHWPQRWALRVAQLRSWEFILLATALLLLVRWSAAGLGFLLQEASAGWAYRATGLVWVVSSSITTFTRRRTTTWQAANEIVDPPLLAAIPDLVIRTVYEMDYRPFAAIGGPILGALVIYVPAALTVSALFVAIARRITELFHLRSARSTGVQ